MKYRCLWCDHTQQEVPRHSDLRVWYKIIGIESNWYYEDCGMCDRCVAHEWKEYRSDYDNAKDHGMREEVEKRAWANWEFELLKKVEKAGEKAGYREALRLEYDGSGGKEKMIRRLRKAFWSKHAPPGN